jgi:SAM-dependent methyltransferase
MQEPTIDREKAHSNPCPLRWPAEPFVWIDDLCALEPSFLSDQFMPETDGLSIDDLALSLTDAAADTRNHVLAHVPMAMSRLLRERMSALAPAANAADIQTAQTKVVAVYLWAMVYHRLPHVYEAFSRLQEYRFERLFPRRELAGRTVADIGCGTGRLSFYAAAHAAHVHAIDPIPAMLQFARAKAHADDRITFHRGSFAEIPLEDQSVDLVVSNLAYQPFERAGGISGIISMKRVLRPGGKIRLTVGNPRAQDFLLEQGFFETFIPRGLSLGAPAGQPLLIQTLIQLARLGAGAVPNELARHYMCAARRWRLNWSIENALVFLSGVRWRDLFLDGNFRRPLGLPVYVWPRSRASGLRALAIKRRDSQS